jgi:phthiodiolone/phenolphthiodiolone dimycocerosates ketoreductase
VAIGVGRPDDVIEMLERFISGTNHFIIRFWGEGYFEHRIVWKKGDTYL